MRTFANMIVFVRDNGTINESRYTEWNELFRGNPRELIEADLENWKEFAKGVSQKFVTVDTALAESLLLDRNADMTARNFAPSEWRSFWDRRVSSCATGTRSW